MRVCQEDTQYSTKNRSRQYRAREMASSTEYLQFSKRIWILLLKRIIPKTDRRHLLSASANWNHLTKLSEENTICLEADHLSLAFLLPTQLEVFGSLDRSLQREEKLNHNWTSIWFSVDVPGSSTCTRCTPSWGPASSWSSPSSSGSASTDLRTLAACDHTSSFPGQT